MDRKTRAFTLEELQEIRKRVTEYKTTDEMSLLVYLLMETGLKVNNVLGWFNRDPGRRRAYLKTQPQYLEDYTNVPVLFPKTHHAYLIQWKRACKSWFGKDGCTFEMLKRKPPKVAMSVDLVMD